MPLLSVEGIQSDGFPGLRILCAHTYPEGRGAYVMPRANVEKTASVREVRRSVRTTSKGSDDRGDGCRGWGGA